MESRILKMRLLIFLSLVFLFCTVALSAIPPFPPDKYVLIDSLTTISGTSNQGFLYIDFPTYRFDTTTGVLTSMLPITVTDNTKVIVGSGLSLGPTVGSGASTGLTPYESFATVGQFSVGADGSVQFVSNGKPVSLVPGQSWTETYNTTAIRGFTGQLVVTNYVTNFGIQDKNKISLPNSPTVGPTPDITAEPTTLPFLCGDANGDGRVDIIDALLVQQYYVGFNPGINNIASDVNGDGAITIVDALLIAQYYVGIRSSLNCR